jgi:hypothetical protein
MRHKFGYAIAPLLLAAGLSAPLPAQSTPPKSDAIEPEAMDALNRMGTYLRSLKEFQVEAKITEEDVLTDGQKVEYGHTTNILAKRPDRLRVEVEGDQKSRLFFYDGKTFTLFARRVGYYATVPAPGTIGQLIEKVTDKYNIEIPLVDLFLWGTPQASTPEITAADDIGPASVDGVTCEHYSYRQPGLDWQVWVQLGDHPLPRKIVITNTTDEARPQHSSVLAWNLAPSYDADAFVFHAPQDAKRIVFGDDKLASAAGK